ncbi:contactin-5-like [Salvelinus sp. IW2-2015]|uniref:contactin-5-like n=1 Tax=Salvelinus sp. IW2-2015 TaxID=2691554 RepID=UPI0038D360E4
MVETVKGTPAVLECEIKGTAPFEITWLKNKKPVVTTDKKYKIVSQESIARLEFCSFESADIGDYQCCIANDVGKITTKALAKLKDRIIPPSFTRSLKRLDGIMGNDISMDCKVSGSQPMTLYWFKDDKEIQFGDRYLPEIKDNSAALKITKLEKVDAGVYTCRATNSAGSEESSGTLYVKEPPVFTLKPDNQDVIPGSTIVLKCAFTGTAPLMIKWFRDDKEISSGGTFFIKKETSLSFLELHSVKPTDSANYTCQVANDAGKMACTAVLFVKGDLLTYTRLNMHLLFFCSCINVCLLD